MAKSDKCSKGVRMSEKPHRKNGIRADTYYSIYYRVGGKNVEEGVGFATEGINFDKAFRLVSGIKENIRTGKSPQSLAEMRELSERNKSIQKKELELKERSLISLNEFWKKEYLPDAILRKKATTVQNEKLYYKNWIAPHLADLPIQSINIDMVQNIVNRAKEDNKSDSTIRYILAIISQVWNFAYLKRIVTAESPTKYIKKPRQDNTRVRFLSPDEAIRLLDAIKALSLDTYDTCIISLFAGLRASEIHSLTWNDVNIAEGTLYIKDPKNKQSRYAYISQEIEEVLNRRHANQVKTEYVIPSRNGKKRTCVSDTFERTVKQIGLNDDVDDNRQKVVFHTLRHTFASWLVKSGTSLYEVSKLLGHQDIKMTQRYAHLEPNKLRKTALSLSGMLEPKPANVIEFTKIAR